MTLSDAVALVRSFLADFSGVVHEDTALETLLEQAANEVAALTLAYERVATFRHTDSPQALDVGARELLLGAEVGDLGLGLPDVLKVLAVHLDGEALTQTTPRDLHLRSSGHPTSGTPRFWYEYAGALGLWPVPDTTALASYTLEVSYAAAVGLWESGALVLPGAYEELVATLTFCLAKMREAQWADVAVTFEGWWGQVQQQPLLLMRPITRKGDLRMPATERLRLQRRAG